MLETKGPLVPALVEGPTGTMGVLLVTTELLEGPLIGQVVVYLVTMPFDVEVTVEMTYEGKLDTVLEVCVEELFQQCTKGVST